MTTDKGRIHGAYAQTRRSFQGIPYAAPPVGPLRWKSPAPVAAWTGTRQATRPGSSCPQASGELGSVPSNNEDCLYLNVTTPKTITGKLPVMVFIHGGGFTSGSGSMYDPAPLVDRGKVIVVTLNYRLGVFGFLGLPQLSAEGGAHKSGLYGIEDQQAALRWVRANATAFGGDARNVTVFGESAGAGSACVQFVSPTAKGLFDKAMAQSGCNLAATSLSQGEARGTALTQAVGCTTGDVVACLRGKSVDELMARQAAGLASGFAPLYGGAALPDTVANLLARGSFARVPLLQGSNHDEGRIFVGTGALGTITAANYKQVIQLLWPWAADAVVAQYPLTAYPSPALAVATVLGDSQFSCRALRASELASSKTKVYQYEFNDTAAPSLAPPVDGFPFGVTHGVELYYLFNLGAPPLNATQQASANRLIDYWTAFAKRGDPNSLFQPYWPAFSPGSKIQSLLSTTAKTISSTTFSTDHHCAFWQPISG
ncbi:carboxylesterase/lipase family protein [Pseudofrankia asymbiotica]|uniref:carboxylesterase/lipase family protein n=1 Tax=Pseudofrankia asymbiotica TaxID=1834516 RepID=UPI001303F948|nr:carboxylesterase family protein [Pseudofrankia asymbiotica]